MAEHLIDLIISITVEAKSRLKAEEMGQDILDTADELNDFKVAYDVRGMRAEASMSQEDVKVPDEKT